MKLIQINAWCGRLASPLSRFIKSEQPDIICMQEVFEAQTSSPKVFSDQYDFLKDVKAASGLAYEFFTPSWGFMFGDTVYDLGIIILSRFPIKNEFSKYTHGNYHVWEKGSPKISNNRNFQTCSLSLPNGQTISLFNYHGYLDGPNETGTEKTVETMQMAINHVITLPSPLIMAGDFNAWPSSPAIKLFDSLDLKNLIKETGVKTTISEVHRAPEEDKVRAACDYIFVSSDVKVNKFSVSEEIVSDHKPLILEFEV